MRLEKIVLSCIAIIIGLLVAGIAFFAYQTTKSIPGNNIPKITLTGATPTPASSLFLTIDQPANESVTKSKTVVVSGKTISGATIMLHSATDDQIVAATSTGSYAITTAITDNENQLTITAIAPNGDEITKVITLTYSTEDF